MSTAGRPEPSEIGARLRTIRRRRGLSLTVAADRAGISKQYLSYLEQGKRGFERRGLLEDLANAVGCAVTDLTGQPYLPVTRDSADALATLPGIGAALYDTTLDDVPDVPTRPIDQLVRWAGRANAHSAEGRYSLAGQDLGDLLTELHVHAVTGSGNDQRVALAALVESCIVAYGNARSLGNTDLAIHAARRAYDAACQLEDPALMGFAAMSRTIALGRRGARRQAQIVVTRAIEDVEATVDPDAENTMAAEAYGILHLAAAQMAAKNRDNTDADTHLAVATDIADKTGECNALQFSFGPANVQAWSLSIAVELDRGPVVAEAIEKTAGYAAGLTSAERKAALHFDLARAYSQAGGTRDVEALRHLDIADRIAATAYPP